MLSPEKLVYIIRHGQTNYYKIGYADQIQKRLNSMQTGNPIKLSIVMAIPVEDYKKCEETVHKQYKDKQVMGEWFDLTQEELSEIIQFIKRWDR